MSNKRITDLTELTNPTTDDVFPVVDIASNTTTKVQLGNLPVPSSVTTALATKQDSLVSGTNIKTINSTSVLGSGNIAVQETLVSGNNIKTLNNTSLLGSGDITIAANPSGVSGAIQFSDGSAFASDAAQLFWDNTNKRLVVGTNTGVAKVHIKGAGNTSATNALYVENSDSAQLLKLTNNGVLSLGLNFPKIAGSNVIGGFSGGFNCVYNNGAYFSVAENSTATMVMDASQNVGIGTSSPTAKTHIRGSGSTSATTSLLVQNSAGSELFKVQDGGVVQSGLIRLDNNGSGRGRMTGVEQINGTSGAGGTRFCTNPDVLLVDASAQLQVDSTTKGFLPPRMTNAQRSAISSPAVGLMVYCTDAVEGLYVYKSTGWTLVI
jgi:hypothetical protein